MGVVSIRLVVTHYFLCFLPHPFLSLSFFCTGEAVAAGFWEQRHCLKPNHRWGFLRLLEFPSTGENYAKMKPCWAPIQSCSLSSACNYLHPPLYQTVTGGPRDTFKFCIKESSHATWISDQNALRRLFVLSYRRFITVFMNRLVRCHQQRCYGNDRPWRRRLSPWKRCLT